MRLPDRSARAARRPRGRPAATALLVGALAGLLFAAAPGAAENGSPNAPGPNAGETSGVDVDLGVLDALPPARPEEQRAPPARKPPVHKPSAARKAAPDAAALPTPAPAPIPAPAPPRLAAPAVPTAPSAPAVVPPAPAAVPVPPPPATTALASPPPPPRSTLPRGGERIDRIAFAGAATALPPEAKATLDVLVQRMRVDERLHLMLNGYAANAGDNSLTRRTALARALAVRAYLVERGIPPMRVDVRAASNGASNGNGGDDVPPDRVDLMASERLPAAAPAPTSSRREDSSR